MTGFSIIPVARAAHPFDLTVGLVIVIHPTSRITIRGRLTNRQVIPGRLTNTQVVRGRLR